jgi:hypothetical protein
VSSNRARSGPICSARLQSRPRGYGIQAPGKHLSRRPIAKLDQGQEPHPPGHASGKGRVRMSQQDAFDRWWEWALKPTDSTLTIPAQVHEAVMQLPTEQRRDRAAVNEAVRLADPDAIMAATSSRACAAAACQCSRRYSQIEFDRCLLRHDSDQIPHRTKMTLCAARKRHRTEKPERARAH